MPPITIYTTRLCSYCFRAKRLLKGKGVTYDEIDVSGNAELRNEMRSRAGGRNTVPQIWIGDAHIGGCDELFSLEKNGTLDALLREETKEHEDAPAK